MLEWTQQILQIGKAFSGSDQTVLQDVLARQSGKFFDAFHDANLQVCVLKPLNHRAYMPGQQCIHESALDWFTPVLFGTFVPVCENSSTRCAWLTVCLPPVLMAVPLVFLLSI